MAVANEQSAERRALPGGIFRSDRAAESVVAAGIRARMIGA
jgi:hypothetical protein